LTELEQQSSFTDTNRRDRILSITAAALLHLGVGYLLLQSFGVDVVRTARSVLKVSTLEAEQAKPPPPPVPEKTKQEEPSGAASARNIKSKATPKEAPKPKVKIKVKNPVTVAEKAATSNDATSGSSNIIGSGTGAGGQGSGTGAGGGGNGGGSAMAARAKLISGRISNKDYPKSAAKDKIGGTVTVYYNVLPSGRVSGCVVKQSSGNAALDETTCRLVEERFRYNPARGRNGEAISDKTGWRQTWWLETGGGRKVTD
jgi:periplasmic protein TonB